ncbi:hypothetical protein [Flavobacterium sp.]|uniref:hypothetical protein n=1 Tax=Flavobacterium sp. TaxID=239 RepID=UPI0026123352|nr:hypothetical protein [Flavobacterium sp.]
MMKIKPYLFCVVVTIVFIVLYFFINTEAKFVLNIHDTYYVAAINHIVLLLFYLFGILSIIYFLFDFIKINLSKVNIWIHILGSILSIASFFYINYLSNELPSQEKGIEYWQNIPDYNLYFFAVILTLITLQFFFIINIIVSIIKKVKSFRASRFK